MNKDFKPYRVWLLAAALVMLWLLFALLSRCGRADAVSDGRDTVSRNACIFREFFRERHRLEGCAALPGQEDRAEQTSQR